MTKNNSAFTEEAMVVPLVKLLGGPIIPHIKKIVDKWLSGNDDEAWQYFSGSWRIISIKFRGKPHSFFVRIRHIGINSYIEISTGMDNPVFREKYEIPSIKDFSKSGIFYSFLKDSIKQFRKGLAETLKKGVTRRYRKLKQDRVNTDNRAPKGTKTFAANEIDNNEETAVVGYVVGALIGVGLVKAYRAIIDAKNKKSSRRIRAWRYVRADRWREIPVKHGSKKQVYYARMDVKKNIPALILSTDTNMKNAIFVKQSLPQVFGLPAVRYTYDQSLTMERIFYRNLAHASKRLETAIKDKRKEYSGDDRKKFDAQIKGRRADMKTEVIAKANAILQAAQDTLSLSVEDRLSEVALMLDAEQLKWECADFGVVSVDDFGNDEQTIIITRKRMSGNPEGFIYVTSEHDRRSMSFKAMNSKFTVECEGIIVNKVEDLSEKLRAFVHCITTMGRSLQEFANGMPYTPRDGEMREYIRANKRKMPQVDRISIHAPNIQIDLTSPFLPNMHVQVFNVKGPKALEKTAVLMEQF